MSKIRTINDLQDKLDYEYSWRIKEIANVKSITKKSSIIKQPTAIRAGIPLLYAHWEGFIKKSSTHYLEYINSQSLSYSDLKSCFVVFGIKRRLNDLIESKKASITVEALDFIRNEMSQKAKLKIASAIRTESNLSSTVFENIAKSIGINTSKYLTRAKLIDESLLNRRNKIAHGEFMDLEFDGFKNLADDIILLIRWYKTDIENAASLQQYKKTA